MENAIEHELKGNTQMAMEHFGGGYSYLAGCDIAVARRLSGV
jgi:hypothetical protein